MVTYLFIIIAVALIFDFINGFHDAANSIATIVSTKVLTPFQAVVWAAGFNFIAYWLFQLAVADTVSKTVHAEFVTMDVILAGLIAAISWNLLTWWWGIPSSSSHTLIGGFAGAAIAASGWDVVGWDKIGKTVAFIALAPIIGMLISFTFSAIMLWICRKGKPLILETWFKRLQLVSSALFSLGHGGNDAQKVMGIIMAAFIAFSHLSPDQRADAPKWMAQFTEKIQVREAEYKEKKAEYKKHEKEYKATIAQYESEGKEIPKELKKPELKITDMVPPWVPIACYFSIAFGTLFGGWKIVKTMGSKITKMTPFEGVAAEAAGAATLFGTGALGIPVSTTHTITGAIIGSGLTKRISAVRWGVTINLLWAWLLTIPVSALLAAGVYGLITLFH